jgi:ubiquinone/menaquinone biosynthesis C-methylase UbiE
MQVKRDFQSTYKSKDDPLNTGDANSERDNFYYEKILSLTKSKNSLLDIGCGLGIFLARFKNDFNILTGIETSEEAISKGQTRYPFIDFIKGTALNLNSLSISTQNYDAIIYNDVINYLKDQQKRSSIKWISEHLNDDGIGFIAAWCPGKNHLTFNELKRLVENYLFIEDEFKLENEHAVFIGKKRKNLIAVTINYETLNPIPARKNINWEDDIFTPANTLIKIFKQLNICLTFMVNMGEYFWLKQFNPSIAIKMEEQWTFAIENGNDVQLHLHPNWLPESGAQLEADQWIWNPEKLNANDYEGDLTVLITKCKEALETTIQKTSPDYRVTSFRAGGFQPQPFKNIFEALIANGIHCDSSIISGENLVDGNNDYSLAYSNHQPYFANPYDPQLKAPPTEQELVEIPIFTYKPGRKWSLSSSEGSVFANRLINYLDKISKSFDSSEWYRLKQWLKDRLGTYYASCKNYHKFLNPLIPKFIAHFTTFYTEEKLTNNNYFIMTGSTNECLDYKKIIQNLKIIKDDGRFQFITISSMANGAKKELSAGNRETSTDEADYQVASVQSAMMVDQRNEAQSFHLQEMIPWDIDTLLDLGCGTGYWADRISSLYPWLKITGADWGKNFIDKAKLKYISKNIAFNVENFENLSFPSNSFDCIYADNVIEHAYDLEKVLNEIYRTLRPNGILVAALPSDARNSERICASHTWKTAPHEVRMRLENAGFFNIEIKEVDTYLELGMPPYSPSDDKMIYISARKYKQQVSPLQRATMAMNWLYDNLDPNDSILESDPIKIITNKYSHHSGYPKTLGHLLKREGFDIRWVTMIAQGHPNGLGLRKESSHVVVEVSLVNGKKIILDPLTNLSFTNTIEELINNPDLSNIIRLKDVRYVEKNYDLYSTSQWYSKVIKCSVGDNYEINS